MYPCSGRFLYTIAFLFLPLLPSIAVGQQMTKSDRQYAQIMLRDVAADVEKYYYDPKLHGVDWAAAIQQTKANIEKAENMDMAVSEIAALLDSLHDSHTHFLPPARNYVHNYGFRIKMIGDRCFIVHVHAGSDAEKKGLRVGDEVLAINDHRVDRKNFPRILYIYWTLRPQPGLRLTLAGDENQPRQLEIMAKVTTSNVLKWYLAQGSNQIHRDVDADRYYNRVRYFDKSDDLLVIRLPEFVLSAQQVDEVIGKMRAHKGVVLDLRDNPGGYIETLTRLLGGFFERDLKAYDRIRRIEKNKPENIVGRHNHAYTGRFVVLIDSGSASASEMFSRVIQLERRGFVLGDRSAGAVMGAQLYTHSVDYIYGASITVWDAVMSDGQSLEHVGVQPDIMVLPTASDIASHFDPALAKAAGLVGVKINAQEAGAMFRQGESEEDSAED